MTSEARKAYEKWKNSKKGSITEFKFELEIDKEKNKVKITRIDDQTETTKYYFAIIKQNPTEPIEVWLCTTKYLNKHDQMDDQFDLFYYPDLKPIMKRLQLHPVMEATFHYNGNHTIEELKELLIKTGFQHNKQMQDWADEEANYQPF